MSALIEGDVALAIQYSKCQKTHMSVVDAYNKIRAAIIDYANSIKK